MRPTVVLACLAAVLASPAIAQQIQWFQSPLNGHWYGVEYRTTTWTQSEAEAVALGGHLATIRSQAEHNWVASTFQSALPPGGLWIGLTDAGHEGTWTWTSGEPVNYLPWYPGQPQGGTSENYGILVGTNAASVPWSWHDAGDGYASSRALIELNQQSDGGWSWPKSYPTGTDPYYHCVADMDADGLPDLVVPHLNAATVAIVRNLGSGQFAPWTSFATVPGAVTTGAADFDHDGHMDVAVASTDGQAVLIHRGDSLGGFVVGQTILPSAQAHGLAVADLNADGWADVAFTAVGVGPSPSLQVALNNGAGVLMPPAVLQTQGDPTFISLADANADGKTDLVVSNASSDSVGTYLNNGAGVFSPAIYSACGANPHRVGVGDFNRDGWVDLAVPNWTAGAVTILTGDGSGSFTSVTGFFPIGSTAWIDVGDVDDDGLPDLVFGHGVSTAISVYLGNGSTTFGSPIMLAGPNWVRSLVLADLDSNGTLDISATGWMSGDVAVILNQATPPHYTNYCTAGTTTNGCTPWIRATGVPSASAASGFNLVCSNVEINQSGIVFYGVNGAKADPWGSGTSFLCVKYPVERTGTLNSGTGVSACDGVLSIDWNHFIATHPNAIGNPFAGGETVWAQGWFRDPPSPKATNLSNGLEFTVAP